MGVDSSKDWVRCVDAGSLERRIAHYAGATRECSTCRRIRISLGHSISCGWRGLGPSRRSNALAARLFSVNRVFMRRQTVLTQKRKKRGPPPTGKGTLIGVRLQPDLLAALDNWASAQKDGLGRPEAIRRLLEVALGRG